MPDDFDAEARWRAARAKVLARRGRCPAAHHLIDEALALISRPLSGSGGSAHR